jgi:pyruvate kinase
MTNERILLDELLRVRADLLAAERAAAALLARSAPDDAESLCNFFHYHALRARDLRPLQAGLARLGLSSLGRSEAHVLATLDAVIGVLARLSGARVALEPSRGAPTFDSGRGRLEVRAAALLGPPAPRRDVRIMVTLSDEEARDAARVLALVQAGMNVARINCAHDDTGVWSALVQHVRAAEAAIGRPCRVMMDLPGPKLRTGPVASDIVLHKGDRVRLVRDAVTGQPRRVDEAGNVVLPFVACTPAEILAAVTVGQPIWFDDGKIGAVVERVDDACVEVAITRVATAGRALREDKGINLPDTRIALPALTLEDRERLPFVVRHADVVAMSFVQSAADVQALDAELARHGATCGTVLKIETKRGFEALPDILVQALSGRPVGVMIARGDLAVEVGFERLAEVQEEILWLCEAAHLPVIWATQVLDRLARKGIPTRAEITDAAMSERAECVMLNKGAHVLEAVRVLDDVLGRMAAHQYKKTAALRPLALSRRAPKPALGAPRRPAG